MTYAFGSDITFWFYPLVNDEPAVIPSAMQSQTPAIYVYRNMPTRAQAAAGEGSPLQTITSWTWDSAKNGWSFTIDGIDDPDPSSAGPVLPYWVAINFRLDTGEQIQTVLRALDLVRVTGHTRALEVTDDDLTRFIPQITAYSSDYQRLDYIEAARSQVKSKLKAQGFAWATVHKPDELKNALVYKTIALFCLIQLQAGNDKFAVKYGEFKELFNNEIESLQLLMDIDGDGAADATKPQGGTIFVMR